MAEKLTDKTIQFDLVSPEKIIVSEQATMVVIPGEAGDFGVLAEHAPLLSSVRPGVVTVTTPDGMAKRIFVSGGFADVNGNICSLLAEEAIDVSDLDKGAAQQELGILKEQQAAAKEDPVKMTYIQRQIEIAEAKIAA